MANQGKGSRWGSLLSQAVAGMEAHLDNMLAEGEGGAVGAKPTQNTNGALKRQPTPVSSKNVPASPRTSSSSNRPNDRLQERLAKAIATRGASTASEAASTRTSTDDGTSTKATERTSLEKTGDKPPEQPHSTTSHPATSVVAPDVVPDKAQDPDVDITQENETQDDGELGAKGDATSVVDVMSSTQVSSASAHLGCQGCDALDAKLLALQTEHRDELHRYIEQVDALQAKVQYLSREASQTARSSAAESLPGTLERKLAERDERIALLMEEGRGMAATEQKQRSIIKKLRVQVGDNERTCAELKAALQDTRTGLAALRTSNSRLEELETTQAAWQTQSTQLRTEVDTLKSELTVKEGIIKSLREEQQLALDEADSTASRALADALDTEKKRARDFEDTIASLQVEKRLVAERAKKREVELDEKATQVAERFHVAQLELQRELQATEGRLEAMRALAEEASSGAVGDSQAKLLRQMETLQTQHAIASENWQGIEASLVARLGNLEKERDDALRRESDMRKKARETALRCKRQEEEIHDLNGKVPIHKQESETFQSRLDSMQRRAEAAEAALSQAKVDFEKQQVAWKAERGDNPDRRLWLEDVPVASPRIQSRPDSPLLSVPARTFSSDLLVLQGPPSKARKISTPGSLADGFHESLSPARRLSSQPPIRPFVLPGSAGLSSSVSIASFDPPRESVQTPISHLGERDDVSDGLETSSSPRQIMQDMVSVSTVGAGPSVQLVERMSAAIRRLEGEKMASREELSRISSQRDEARAEMVALMKETQSGKAASLKVSELEAEVADINARYQTTLELLGEKSELVEELRADVDDVKAMYRDLVERTVKG